MGECNLYHKIIFLKQTNGDTNPRNYSRNNIHIIHYNVDTILHNLILPNSVIPTKLLGLITVPFLLALPCQLPFPAARRRCGFSSKRFCVPRRLPGKRKRLPPFLCWDAFQTRPCTIKHEQGLVVRSSRSCFWDNMYVLFQGGIFTVAIYSN